MARYLVTGGAGFIGSHLVEALRARGEDVRVVDNLSSGRRANLAHVAGVELVVGDLGDLAVAQAAVRGMDYVLHQAAIPSVPASVADPLGTHRANLDATVNLLVASRDAGVRRLVFAGSSAVYGDAPGLPKEEAMHPAPRTPYALQKLASESYCRLFHELYGFETVVTRYFNVFGPRQDPGSPYSGVISLFISALVEGRTPVVFGDGGQTRDFVYVDDVVTGVLRAATAPHAAGAVMNLATGAPVTLLGLLETLAGELAVPAAPAFEAARAGDIRHSEADITRARRVLGYAPAVPLAEGLRRTVAWYRGVVARQSGGV